MGEEIECVDLSSLPNDTLENAAFELILQLESEDNTEALVEALFQEAPDNPKVQSLRADTLLDETEAIANQDWQDLMLLLQGVPEAVLIQTALRAFHTHCGSDVMLHRPQLTPNMTWEQLKRTLREDEDDPELLVVWINGLLPQYQIPSQRHNLEQWRDRFTQTHQLKPSPLQAKPQIGQASLLIVVEQTTEPDILRIIPELQWGDHEPVPLDLDDSERGFVCSLSDRPKKLQALLQRAEECLIAQNSQKVRLVIEVFLEVNYLNQPVSLWEVSDPFGPSTLGSRYPVIVRSSERARDLGYLRELESNWSELQQHLKQQTLDKESKQIQTWAEIEALECECGSRIALHWLGRFPPLKRRQILVSVLKMGFPLVLWIYDDDGPSNLTVCPLQTSDLFNTFCGKLSELQTWTRFLTQVRYQSRRDRPHRYISVLLDDPNRIHTKLRSPARLSS